MKNLLLTTIAAVVLVGCGESKKSAPVDETKPVDAVAQVQAHLPSPVEVKTVAGTSKPESLKSKPLTPKRLLKAASENEIKLVKEHLAAGVDVNTKDKEGWSPLYHAALYGYYETVELLISSGADLNSLDEDGFTPLHKAAGQNHWEIVELLISNGAEVNATVKSGILKGTTPLDFGYDESAALLRKHGGKTGEELKAEEK